MRKTLLARSSPTRVTDEVSMIDLPTDGSLPDGALNDDHLGTLDAVRGAVHPISKGSEAEIQTGTLPNRAGPFLRTRGPRPAAICRPLGRRVGCRRVKVWGAVIVLGPDNASRRAPATRGGQGLEIGIRSARSRLTDPKCRTVPRARK